MLFPFLVSAPCDGRPSKKRIYSLARNVQAEYNRVDGMSGSYRLLPAHPRLSGLQASVRAGYGLHSQAFRWETGFSFTRGRHTLSASAYDRAETSDRDLISDWENSLFALLFKGDYRDYYRAKNGFEIKGAYQPRAHLTLTGRLAGFDYRSLAVETQWSLFRNNRSFRPNPAVRTGRQGLLQIGAVYDTRSRRPVFLNAWVVSTVYERGFKELPFDGIVIDVDRHQKTIFGSQAFSLRARVASRSSGAEQHLFDLGGVGTLRGFDIKAFSGNRLVSLNIDYLFRGDLMARVPLKGFHLLNTILFFDTGWAGTAAHDRSVLNGFQHIRYSGFHSNLGIALGVTERLVRINLARALNRGREQWTFSMRFFKEL